MILGGYQKLTLIDYPGKLATTVFTVGCNFRCPFCHNPELVDSRQFTVNSNLEKEFFKFLKSRKGKLDGVCVTGGEPLIQPDIFEFIKKIKKLGFLVKLDTNGSRPDALKKIIDGKIVDYIAMDIKNSKKRYSETCGYKTDIKRLELSVDLIRNSGIDYEFRTTVVPGIHAEKDFADIVEWISGAKNYYLQKYREIKILDPRLKRKTKGKKIDLEKIKSKIEKNFGKVGIRR
ncbi:MAG: anaerobic ribonucleoside-triphosphate reductase activating protein [Candidatus Doudnabacteria bacterium RIFCSPHIGHO2_02_FULL_43_13b]|nr:MAG: anaerobic ribonucleoside-triphosphate reductase activating protein [Candidatus Doudnabacteria bacterium RIFCSPHIGHO2_02_FULL_43_13b]